MLWGHISETQYPTAFIGFVLTLKKIFWLVSEKKKQPLSYPYLKTSVLGLVVNVSFLTVD